MIKIAFSGDFAPINNYFIHDTDPFKKIVNLFDDVDLHITNLECPLTNSNDKIIKTGPHLKSKPENSKFLSLAKVNIACLANNHIFDYGEIGIKDTIKLCNNAGIKPIGIVNNKKKAQHWIIEQIDGKNIGFVNYCEHEFSVRADGLIGANGFDPISAFDDVKEVRSKVDFLVAIYHGGNEYYQYPNPKLKTTFHFLVDIGFDAVIGHHTHVFSGYEYYKEKPIVYSLGNFYFPYPNEPKEWYEGLVCKLSLNDEIKIELIPIVQSKQNYQLDFPNKERLKIIKRSIVEISKKIEDDVALKLSWEDFVNAKRVGYIKQIMNASILSKILLKLGIDESRVFKKTKLVELYNILRCEAHYELIKESLNLKYNEKRND